VEKICTCHPDDKPPIPCAQKFALKDCRLAAALEAVREHLADDGALRWTEGTQAEYLWRSHELLVAIAAVQTP